MPFDFKEYQSKCDGMTTAQLHKEWENYTRQISGGATGTATSVLFAPVTGGISLMGLGLSAPKIHNARKKREIIEAGLKARGTTHNTRKRDVIAPMAITGVISGATLGLAGPAANAVAGQVVEHGIEYAAAHVALDAGGAVLEHQHGKHHHNKANAKLQAQYENFKIQYAREQAAAQGIQLPLSGYQPGLQIPGSVQSPQPASPMSPNGVNVPGGANMPGPPPYQPQGWPGASQDQKYEHVPIPVAYDSKPQQATAQQQTQQQTTFYTGAALQINTYQSISQQQSFASTQQTSLFQQQPVTSTAQQPVIPSGYSSEKPPIQQSALQQQPQHVPAQPTGNVSSYAPEKPPVSYHPSPCPTPAPAYSPPQTTPIQHVPPPPQHRPSLPTPAPPHVPIHRPSLPASPPPMTTPQSPIYEMSTSTGRTTPTRNDSMLSMEEELALLRMKILQMELEKRGEHIEIVTVEDEDESGDEKPRPPEIPETFPTEAYAPEPPRKPQEANVETSDTNKAASVPASSSPKLNPFVEVHQPAPLKIARPPQPPTPQNTLPYPTFSTPTPRPQEQQYQPPPSQLTQAVQTAQTSAPPAPTQESVKHGFSITGGISISYNRDTAQSQPPTDNQPQYTPPQTAPIYATQQQHAQMQNQGPPLSPIPPPQQSTSQYQTYNPNQRAQSIPLSPQQQMAPQSQGVPISYTPTPPPQQATAGYQTYQPAQQASATPVQQQQTFALPQKPPHQLQHQDSGYYSNPPSRHSSTFSVSTVDSPNLNYNQHVVSPPTPSFATLNPQATGPQQPQYQHARHASYGPMPMSYTPSPMTPQPQQSYFPPPPPHRASTPNPQTRGYQPAPLAPAAPIYGSMQDGQQYQPAPAGPNYGAQQGVNQGWQWGNPNAGAAGEPNYGPPPPIPGQWRGS